MKKTILFLILINLLSVITFSQNVNLQKFRLGVSYEERGEIENAERIFEELIKSEPNNDDFFDAYSRVMKLQNKFSELLPYIAEKVKKKETLRNLDLFAELNWRLGKTNEANSAWEKALNLYKNTPETYIKIAQTQLNLRLFDKATATFLQGRKDIGSKNTFADELSRLYIATGNYKEGIEEILNLLYLNLNIATAQGRVYALITNQDATVFLEERLKSESEKNQNNMLSQELYAWFLRTTNKLDNALDVYIRLDALKKSNGMEILNFANISVQDGQYDIGIKAYNIILDKGKNHPYNASALYGVTRAMELKLVSKKNFTNEELLEIIKFYDEVITTYQNSKYSADARYRTALIQYKSLKNIKEAKIQLEILLKEASKLDVSGSAGNLLAEIYIAENDLITAKKLYRDVIERNFSALPADKETAKFMLAEIEFFTENFDSARALYVQIVQNSNSDAANDAFKRISIIDASVQFVKGLQLYAKAELMIFQNKPNDAIKFYLESSESAKGSVLSETSLFKSAEIYYNQKNYPKAIEIVDILNKENSESVFADDAIMLVGDCYAAENKIEEAIKAYSDLLVKFPDSVMLQVARKKIRSLRNEKI